MEKYSKIQANLSFALGVFALFSNPLFAQNSKLPASCLEAGGAFEEIGKRCFCKGDDVFVDPRILDCPAKRTLALASQALAEIEQRDPLFGKCGQLTVLLGGGLENAPDFDSCGFLPKKPIESPDENWFLRASGGDFFREHPLVRETAYTQHRLAIVDTGMIVRENPGAGANAAEDSPDMDFDEHGTFVYGVAASERHGLNPHMRVRVFPTKHPRSQPGVIAIGGQGFDRNHLIQNIREAGASPDISVINISISIDEDKELLEAVESALDAGKWIVYAAGNDGAANSVYSAGLRRFEADPRLFTAGALSTFAAPSGFSNFGSNVRFFAPGSQIDSLSANFNPNLYASAASTRSRGTSYANPQEATLLATIRAIRPSISSEDAGFLLEISSIPRSLEPIFSMQLNPLLVAEILSRTKSCKKESLRQCFLKERDAIRREAIQAPKIPGGADCLSWENYYAELRRRFFLSRADFRISGSIAKLLARAGKRNTSDFAYFAPDAMRRRLITSLREPERYSAKESDLARAQRLLHSANGTPPEILTPDTIQRLNPRTQNIREFMKICGDTFFKSRENLVQSCATYLLEAPMPFREAIAREFIREGKPILLGSKVMRTIVGITLDSNETKQLHALIIEGWRAAPDLQRLSEITRYFDMFSQNERNQFIAAIADARRNRTLYSTEYNAQETMLPDALDKLQNYYLAWSDPEVFAANREKIFAAMPNNDPSLYHPLNNELKALYYQALAGHPQANQVRDFFHRFAPALGDLNNWSGQQTLMFASDNKMLEDLLNKTPGSAKFFAEEFLRHPNGALALKYSHLLPFLANSNEIDRKTLLRLFSLSAGTPGTEESDIAAYALFKVLESTKKNPAAIALYQSIQESPQSDPLLQGIRLEWLENAAQSALTRTPIVNSYLRESQKPKLLQILHVRPEIVLNDPELNPRVQELVNEIRAGNIKPASLTPWLMQEQVHAHPQVRKILLENFTDFISESSDYRRTAEEISSWLVTYYGRDQAALDTALSGLDHFLQSKEFLEREGRGLVAEQGGAETAILIGQILGTAAGFPEAAARHPETIQRLADLIVDIDYKDPFRSPSPEMGYPLQEPLRSELIRRLPDPARLNPKIRLPSWMAWVFYSAPKETAAKLNEYRSVLPEGKLLYELNYTYDQIKKMPQN